MNLIKQSFQISLFFTVLFLISCEKKNNHPTSEKILEFDTISTIESDIKKIDTIHHIKKNISDKKENQKPKKYRLKKKQQNTADAIIGIWEVNNDYYYAVL